jgi:transcriptional regulator with XRE-family HTH domain
MDFNERIRAVREDRDMTQSEVAKIIGVAQSYYSKQERGKSRFRSNKSRYYANFSACQQTTF